MTTLQISHLSAGYGNRPILRDVSLTVNAGEVVALVGPNGAGKSTLIRVVSGVVAARAGEVRLDEVDLLRIKSMARARLVAVVSQMIHLPVHASWLNQVEIYFSVVQRKLITPDDFADTDELARQITAFEKRYNQAARPFDWRFSRNDLNHLLNRLAA